MLERRKIIQLASPVACAGGSEDVAANAFIANEMSGIITPLAARIHLQCAGGRGTAQADPDGTRAALRATVSGATHLASPADTAPQCNDDDADDGTGPDPPPIPDAIMVDAWGPAQAGADLGAPQWQ